MSNVTDTFYASDGFVGYGSQWEIGQDDGSPETFVAVAQIASIKFGDMSTGIVNKTHLRSPGAAHEKIATIRDIGPFAMTGTLNIQHGSLNNAGGDGFVGGGLIALHRARTERNMKIVLSDTDTTELPFRGVISKLNLGDVTLEGLVMFSCEVQPLQDYTASLP